MKSLFYTPTSSGIREISENLKEVLKSAIKIVNFIKGSSLNSRIFWIYCSEIGALTPTYCITQKFVGCHEARHSPGCMNLDLSFMFSVEINNPLALRFEDDVWITKLAYVTVVSDLLNDLNMKLHGKSGNIFKHIEYIDGFQKMLRLWHVRYKNDHTNYYMFTTLLRHTVENVVGDDILI